MKTLISSLIFTLTTFFSLSSAAQRPINHLKDLQVTAEGIVYNPAESSPSFLMAAGNTLVSYAKKIFSPIAAGNEFCSKIQDKYAHILNRNAESLSNTSLFTFIDQWWGTKYRFGGSTKKGIDCSSFSGLLMGTVFGFALPRTAREQYKKCRKLAKAELTEGDLVFFNTRGGVSHVGVYLGDGNFVHSASSKGVNISNLEDSYYKQRFIAGGRPETGGYN